MECPRQEYWNGLPFPSPGDLPDPGIRMMSSAWLEAQLVKESACNAGDPGSISESGRYVREGIGYLLQYSWASLVTQMVKNLPTMWETWVQSLG